MIVISEGCIFVLSPTINGGFKDAGDGNGKRSHDGDLQRGLGVVPSTSIGVALL